MSVTRVDKDFDSLTLTLVADFDAPIERVWQLWADPRLLRWLGPVSRMWWYGRSSWRRSAGSTLSWMRITGSGIG